MNSCSASWAAARHASSLEHWRNMYQKRRGYLAFTPQPCLLHSWLLHFGRSWRLWSWRALQPQLLPRVSVHAAGATAFSSLPGHRGGRTGSPDHSRSHGCGRTYMACIRGCGEAWSQRLALPGFQVLEGQQLQLVSGQGLQLEQPQKVLVVEGTKS